MKITNKQVEVFSELAVVDVNPEMADVDNPTGEIIREVYFAVVTFFDGSRTRHNRSFQNKGQADMLRDRIFILEEINLDYWSDFYPVYGSPASEVEQVEQFYKDQF